MYCKLLTPVSTYIVNYPQAIEFTEMQNDAFWLPDEIEVEKDLHDLKTNFTESEKHGVITTLKLFTLYELLVGDEYWTNVISKYFQHPSDIQRMANCFSFFELNVHAPFYNKLNEVLGLNTHEFYTSYTKDPVLKKRMSWIGKQLEQISVNGQGEISDPVTLLKSIGTFSMVEGAILYSSFAFLKHFQAEGKNKLVNVTAGINFSVKDENLHSEAGAWLFRVFLDELMDNKFINDKKVEQIHRDLSKTAIEIYEHECRIIDMIFENGSIKGITDLQLKNFVQSRLDICLENLGIEKKFKPAYNPIAKWFYKNIGMGQLHDFFYKQGNQYTRDWSESKFTW